MIPQQRHIHLGHLHDQLESGFPANLALGEPGSHPANPGVGLVFLYPYRSAEPEPGQSTLPRGARRPLELNRFETRTWRVVLKHLPSADDNGYGFCS